MDINLCEINGVSFFVIVCENEYDVIVEYLLSEGVDFNLGKYDIVKFFYIVCIKEYSSIL